MTATEKYLEAGRSLTGALESQMFGKPCFKINGKAFVCLFDESMVFKLGGHAHREALSLEGSRLFDPSGRNRPMKEWVQVPSTHQERWAELAQLAKTYVESLQPDN